MLGLMFCTTFSKLSARYSHADVIICITHGMSCLGAIVCVIITLYSSPMSFPTPVLHSFIALSSPVISSVLSFQRWAMLLAHDGTSISIVPPTTGHATATPAMPPFNPPSMRSGICSSFLCQKGDPLAPLLPPGDAVAAFVESLSSSSNRTNNNVLVIEVAFAATAIALHTSTPVAAAASSPAASSREAQAQPSSHPHPVASLPQTHDDATSCHVDSRDRQAGCHVDGMSPSRALNDNVADGGNHVPVSGFPHDWHLSASCSHGVVWIDDPS